jgi:hypothetical protein
LLPFSNSTATAGDSRPSTQPENWTKCPVVLLSGADSHEGIIDFVAWSRDSNRVLLTLRVGDFDGVRQRGVYLWYLYFNTRENKFELTDRLRAANEGAWKRRENFGEEDAAKFKELTSAEPVDQSVRSKSQKK